jgi:hypothetical protein
MCTIQYYNMCSTKRTTIIELNKNEDKNWSCASKVWKGYERSIWSTYSQVLDVYKF